MKNLRPLLLCSLALTALLAASPCLAQSSAISSGQLVWVPAYSHIFQGPRNIPLELTVHLLVHNLSRESGLEVVSVEYHNERGELVREYMDKPVQVPPLGAWNLVLPEKDDTGDLGSCFVVRWRAPGGGMVEPLVETVMVTTKSQLGVSFRAEGRVLESIK